MARCKYDTPTEFDSVSLLNQNVASERCAILRYQEIANFTNGKDYTGFAGLSERHCQNERIFSEEIISSSFFKSGKRELFCKRNSPSFFYK